MNEKNDNKIMYMLGQIDSNVKSLMGRADNIDTTLKEHDHALDELKKIKDQAIGKVAGVSFVVSILVAIGSFVLNWFK